MHCTALPPILQMTILTEGEVVNELMIIVDGEVQGARTGSAAALAHSNSARQKDDQPVDVAMDMQQRVKVGVNEAIHRQGVTQVEPQHAAPCLVIVRLCSRSQLCKTPLWLLGRAVVQLPSTLLRNPAKSTHSL